MDTHRSAKIVATVGPASCDEDTLTRMIQAGVNVARLNFSHGDHNFHAEVVQRLRTIASRLGISIGILQDLQGPKIRTGEIASGGVFVSAGQVITLTTKPLVGTAELISVDFPEFLEGIVPGSRILVDDGLLELQVTSVSPHQAEAVVVHGGLIKSHKGINLPGSALNIPGFTKKDAEDLAFGLKLGVDFVAVSFVRRPEDVLIVQQEIHQHSGGRQVPVIAKLERQEAIEKLAAILEASDGVMVARGDLGVEMSPEAVPIAQKQIISAANRAGKLVITATQMLDSMINQPRPTRAEASDVANAIFDGTDAVMLSGETAAGKYPIESVKTMDAIIRQAELHLGEWGRWQGDGQPIDPCDDTYFITRAAHELALDRNVAAICIFTRSGRSAQLMSKTRPNRPILAFTPETGTCQRLNMAWGVTPYLVPPVNSLEEMVAVVDGVMVARGAVEPGQEIVLICGFPVPAVKPTNLALLHRVGEDV